MRFTALGYLIFVGTSLWVACSLWEQHFGWPALSGNNILGDRSCQYGNTWSADIIVACDWFEVQLIDRGAVAKFGGASSK